MMGIINTQWIFVTITLRILRVNFFKIMYINYTLGHVFFANKFKKSDMLL